MSEAAALQTEVERLTAEQQKQKRDLAECCEELKQWRELETERQAEIRTRKLLPGRPLPRLS